MNDTPFLAYHSRELVDDADFVTQNYPDIKSGKKKLTVMLDETMDSNDFAITRGHIICINADAYRDAKKLEEEYDKLVKDGWFAKGTDYHSIIKHEIGHVVSNRYNIDSVEIGKEIIKTNSATELILYVRKRLSNYSAQYIDGSEIISECFSSVYGSNENNSFALQFVKECDRIISKKR